LLEKDYFKEEFIFLSCGDFDGNHMKRETEYKGLNTPSYLKRWINIKKVFPVHLFDPSRKENIVKKLNQNLKPPVRGMPDMLELCGLELEGRHHSGIDDARNIARCAIKCLEKGFEFQQQHVLSRPY